MPGISFPRTSILKSSWWGCPPSVKFFSKILYPPGYHIIMLIKLRAVKLWIKYVNEQNKIFRSLTAYYSLGLLLHQFHLMSVFVLGLRLTNLLKFPLHGTRTKRKKLNNSSSSSLRRHFFDYFFSCGKSDRIRFLSHYIEGISVGNGALFLQLGLASTLIHYKNGVFRKHPLNRRKLKRRLHVV